MTTLLPDIGRNGLVNSVRRIAGLSNPGFRAVDPTISFVAGTVATLAADTNGNPVLQVADDTTSTGIIGLFYCHKTTSFYRPICDESQTFAAAPNTAFAVYLNFANIKSGYTKVYNYTRSLTCALSTDFTVNTTNGVITRTSTGNIQAGNTILVTYFYTDPDLTGIDQTLGSGMAATIEDVGDVATLVYDTSKAYTVMCKLYVNADGYITSTQSSGNVVVGYCTKPPTSDNPELWFKMIV